MNEKLRQDNSDLNFGELVDGLGIGDKIKELDKHIGSPKPIESGESSLEQKLEKKFEGIDSDLSKEDDQNDLGDLSEELLSLGDEIQKRNMEPGISSGEQSTDGGGEIVVDGNPYSKEKFDYAVQQGKIDSVANITSDLTAIHDALGDGFFGQAYKAVQNRALDA